MGGAAPCQAHEGPCERGRTSQQAQIGLRRTGPRAWALQERIKVVHASGVLWQAERAAECSEQMLCETEIPAVPAIWCHLANPQSCGGYFAMCIEKKVLVWGFQT